MQPPHISRPRSAMTGAAAAVRGPARRLEDRQFELMRSAFAEAGGICDGDRVVRLLRPHRPQPISVLARWIVDRRIVSFTHLGLIWVPMFQFDRSSMDLDTNVERIVDELSRPFDDWELALWFASPNGSLKGAAPVDAIGVDPATVHEVARMDRFIALV